MSSGLVDRPGGCYALLGPAELNPSRTLGKDAVEELALAVRRLVALVCCCLVCIHRDFSSGWAQEVWDQADCWLAGVCSGLSFCVGYQILYLLACNIPLHQTQQAFVVCCHAMLQRQARRADMAQGLAHAKVLRRIVSCPPEQQGLQVPSQGARV